MKAENAKNKWCPMVRANYTAETNAWQGGALTNRGDIIKSGFPDTCCLGPDCMAWFGDKKEGDCGLVLSGIAEKG